MSVFNERDVVIVRRAGDGTTVEDGTSTCMCGVLDELITSGGQ